MTEAEEAFLRLDLDRQKMEIRRLRALAQHLLAKPEDARRIAAIMLTERLDGIRPQHIKVRVPAESDPSR